MCMKANFLETENDMAMTTSELEYSKMTIDRLEEALELITDGVYKRVCIVNGSIPDSLVQSTLL